MPLRYHVVSTPPSLGAHGLLLRFHADPFAKSLRLEFDFNSNPLWLLVDPTSIACRSRSDCTSTSLRFICMPLRVRFEFTPASNRHYLNFVSNSLRSLFNPFHDHSDFTWISLPFHFGVTSMSLRCHFKSHLDVTSMKPRFHFGFVSNLLRFHLEAVASSHLHNSDLISS